MKMFFELLLESTGNGRTCIGWCERGYSNNNKCREVPFKIPHKSKLNKYKKKKKIPKQTVEVI